VIRTDNGVSVSSAQAIYGLSTLAVWWLRLGIQIERIQPGHLQQNGRHERMHLTLKREPPSPLRPTSCNNRRASIPVSHATTRSGRTRRSR
jgi:transposase InsO family protein